MKTMKLFSGELDWIEEVDLNKDLKDVQALDIWKVVAALTKHMRAAASDGRLREEAVYRFLHALCSFQPAQTPGTESYKPLYLGEERGEVVPEALAKEDALALARMVDRLARPELRTRLCDLHWLATKDRTSLFKAVEGYIELAKLHAEADDTIEVMRALKRALQLALPRGRRSELFDKARMAALDITAEYLRKEDVFGYKECADIILEFGLSSPKELIAPLEKLAEIEWAKDQGFYAEQVYGTAITAARRTRDLDFEHRAFRRIGEMKVITAIKRCEGPSGSFMMGGMILKEAIQILQKGRAEQVRIDELKRMLTDYQRRGSVELKPYSFEIDIEEPVNMAREWVRGQPFGLALRRLSNIQKLTDVDALRRRVEGNTEMRQWDQLFTTLVMDGDGRHRQIRRGYADLTPEQKERTLQNLMFSEVLYEWSLRVQAFIEPARMQFTDEHSPSQQLILPAVLYSTFVPDTHAGLFLRGLHAGFYGEWMIAAHLLVPQFEACIRHFLALHEVDVTSIKEDGTQQNKSLRDLLLLEDAKRLLGESACFELRGVLAEEGGWNLRNKLAHGMLGDAQCYGAPTVLAWWLALRLCLANLELPHGPRHQTGS